MRIWIVAALAILTLITSDLGAQEKDKGEEKTASQAYKELVEKLGQENPQNREEYQTYIQKVKKLFLEFANKYPTSPQGIEAKTQVAVIYIQVENDPTTGIEILKEVLNALGNKPEKKLDRAKITMEIAGTYKDMEKFEESKTWFARLAEENPDSPFERVAKESLEMITIQEQLQIGKKPIPFEFESLEKKKVSLSQYEGKVVLIDFWATWCTPCKMELPNLRSTFKEYNEKGFEIIGISLDQGGEQEWLKSFIKRNKMTWPNYFDGGGWNNKIAKKYGIMALPATFLLDRKGTIRYKNLMGPMLKQKVAELVAEK